MKNRFHVFTITVLMLCSTIAIAAREPEVNVSSPGENKLMMKLFTHEESALIRIMDKEGNLLFSEKTGTSALYQKIFDFKTLNNGSYIIEIEGENSIQLVYFNLSKGKLIITEDVITTYKPVIRLKGNMADFQLLNTSEEKVKVTFYDQKGQLLLRHAPEPGIRVEKRFNLSELEPGSYSMSVQVGERSYLKKIVIE